MLKSRILLVLLGGWKFLILGAHFELESGGWKKKRMRELLA